MIREIKEELDTEIKVGNLISTIEYDYPTFHLSMDCFWCEIVRGNLVLKEAQDARWLTKENLFNVNWLPADKTIIEIIKKQMREVEAADTAQSQIPSVEIQRASARP